MYKWMTGILCAGCVLLQAGSEKILHIDFEKPLAKKDVTGRIALKLQGTPETVPGVVGSALFFNGNKQALRSSSKALRFSENESFTVEFYIKPERNPGKYWPNPVYVSGLRFAGRPHINSPFLFMSDGKKRLIVTGTGTSDFNGGKWHHIALVRDAASRQITYYCNGKQVSRIRETSRMTAVLARPDGIYTGSGGWINYFRGAVDELIVWKGVRKKFDLSAMKKINRCEQPAVKTDPGVAASWKILKEKKLSLVPAPKSLEITGKGFAFVPEKWHILRKNPADRPGYEIFLKRLGRCGLKNGFTENGKKYIIAGSAKEVAGELSRKISQPPREGYILEVTPQKIVICGTDDNGLRYGWLTLAALLRENGTLPCVFIRDYPDFKMRLGHYSPMHGTEKSLKKLIDEVFMMRLNCLTTTQIMGLIRLPDHVAEVNAYAAERGIICGFTGVPSVEDIPDHKNKIPKGQDSHAYDYRKAEGMFGWKSHAISWSRDDLAAEQAKRVAAFMKKYNFKHCILHPVDAGGIDNPSRWNSRSPRCRARWGNDFFAAQEHLIGIYCDTIKKHAPGCLISYVAYPYAPRMLILEDWQKHLQKMEKRLGKEVMMLVREGVRHDMEKLQKTVSNIITVFYPFQYDYLNLHSNGARHFCTFYTAGLESKTGYEIWAPAGPTGHASRYTCTEYMWNAFAPGAENMPEGLYTSFELTLARSKEIEEELLPRICAWIYGEKAASVMAEVFAARLSLRHGEHPFKILPGSVDPEKFFAEASAVTEKLSAAMSRIRKDIPAERMADFMTKFTYVRRVHLISRARLDCIRANKLADEGKIVRAQETAAKAMALLKAPLVRSLSAAKIIRGELDISEKIRSGHLKRRYALSLPPCRGTVGFYQYIGTGNGGTPISVPLMQSLDKIGGLRTVSVSDPTVQALRQVDVMVFAATHYVGDTTENWRKNIRDMVEKRAKA